MSQIDTAASPPANVARTGEHAPFVAARQGRSLERAYRRLTALLRRGGLRGLVGMAGRCLGIAFRYRAHRRWMKTIGGETTRRILEDYPRIAFRHSTTYLYEGLSWSDRLSLLKAHYRFLNETHEPAFFSTVIGSEGLTLLRLGASADDLTIALVGPCLVSRHREGELGLQFSINGTVVYKIAFSVVPLSLVGFQGTAGGSRLGLFVGQVQGSADCLGLIRNAAKLCHDVAPRDLLMSALLGIAQAWDMDRIVGARGDLVLSNGSCGFDYNAFWEQYGGEPMASGHYAMTLPFHEGPLRASSSAHRRRTRKKREFQAEVSGAVAGMILQERDLPGLAAAEAQLDALKRIGRTAPQPIAWAGEAA